MDNIKKIESTGFSLTEMSVTIVISALIVSSALQGKSMIESAKLRAITVQANNFKVALNSFISKYDAYPGDFDKAATFWSGSVNGNSDGTIQFKNSSSVYEGYRAWQHLSYAGMVDNIYAGTQTTSAAVPGTDIPPTKDGRGGYFFEYNAFGLTNTNFIAIGKPVAIAGSSLLVGGLLTPSQAFDIDSKFDDSLPAQGSIRGADGSGSTAQSCVVTASSTYAITLKGIDCTMAFRIATSQ